MNLIDAKKALRSEVRAAERALSPRYRASSNAGINARLLALPEFAIAQTVFAFVGTAREIDTRSFLAETLCRGKRLCVPLCTGPGIMELRRIASFDDLAPGAYGIPEPKADCPAVPLDEIDFAVIPCVSCDREGHRLGQGGGFYDRFLAAYRGPAYLVCRERLLRSEIPMEPHDAIIHWVVTEKALYEDGIPEQMS